MTDISSNWTMVVAASENDIIGNQGDLPWKLRSDLQRFKKMTMGHCLVMGRKTYESIGRPLPGRQTIVLSRSGYIPNDERVVVAETVEDVRAKVEPGRELMVVGGAEIYRLLLPHCNTLWLTRVLTTIQGDTKLPEVVWSDWSRESSEEFAAGEHDDWPTRLEIWKRSTRSEPRHVAR